MNFKTSNVEFQTHEKKIQLSKNTLCEVETENNNNTKKELRFLEFNNESFVFYDTNLGDRVTIKIDEIKDIRTRKEQDPHILLKNIFSKMKNLKIDLETFQKLTSPENLYLTFEKDEDSLLSKMKLVFIDSQKIDKNEIKKYFNKFNTCNINESKFVNSYYIDDEGCRIVGWSEKE